MTTTAPNAVPRLPAPLPQRGKWAPFASGAYFAVAAAAVSLLVACSSAPKAAAVSGNISAAANLNPSVSQRPSPLVLRLYELRSPTAFNQADFVSLYQSDTTALAADLVARDEMMLQPGESRAYARQLNADTRFIGVVGAYRNIEKATWRTVVPVRAGAANKLTIRADSLAVSATVTR